MDTIQNYIITQKNNLSQGKIDLEEYLEANDVDDVNINALLNSLLKQNLINKFCEKYEKYLFQLKIKDRLYYQNQINSKKKMTKITFFLKKNIIHKNEIKQIFKSICNDIIIMTNISNNIKNIFEKNGVYFKEEINNKIPNKLGTYEFQYYCILNDIYYYFQDNRIVFSEKKNIFNDVFELIIENLDELIDDEIISIFNYLVNILYIYLEQKNINMQILANIVDSCLPFNKTKAESLLKYLKIRKKNFLKINGKYTCQCKEIEVKENDMINLKMNKIEIKIQAKYVNWNFSDKRFEYNLKSGLFMLCIRYPYNCKYNFFSLDEKISESLDSLFKKMIQSDPVEKAMMSDSEAKKFEYLFKNDKILDEFKTNIHFVVFPFSNYYGYTDKKSFDIYLNIYINLEYDLFKILSTYETFLISRCHEYKHSTRIYMRIFGNSEIKTPRINLTSRDLIAKIDKSKLIISKSNVNYPKNSLIFKNYTNEYGESFEIALFGYKVEILFIKSVIFCLDIQSWDKNSEEFYNEFINTMKYDKVIKIKEECKTGLACLIYEYFNFAKTNDLSINAIIDTKGSNLSDTNYCRFVTMPRASHHLNRNEENNTD